MLRPQGVVLSSTETRRLFELPRNFPHSTAANGNSWNTKGGSDIGFRENDTLRSEAFFDPSSYPLVKRPLSYLKKTAQGLSTGHFSEGKPDGRRALGPFLDA
jgi:hypothetical protein